MRVLLAGRLSRERQAPCRRQSQRGIGLRALDGTPMPMESTMVQNALIFPWTEGEMLLRLVCATIAGGLIGWNRHRAGKPAGIGTHALVALGAGLFVAIPSGGGATRMDALSRAIQGVAAGVGFLGAGEIFRDASDNRIVGLTSAAALWVTAALGLTIVAGPMTEAIFATLLVVAVLELAPRIERRLPVRGGREHGRHRNAERGGGTRNCERRDSLRDRAGRRASRVVQFRTPSAFHASFDGSFRAPRSGFLKRVSMRPFWLAILAGVAWGVGGYFEKAGCARWGCRRSPGSRSGPPWRSCCSARCRSRRGNWSRTPTSDGAGSCSPWAAGRRRRARDVVVLRCARRHHEPGRHARDCVRLLAARRHPRRRGASRPVADVRTALGMAAIVIGIILVQLGRGTGH